MSLCDKLDRVNSLLCIGTDIDYFNSDIEYKTSLYFKIKDSVVVSNVKILDIFFKDWVDDICNNEVRFVDIAVNIMTSDNQKLVRVDFVHEEDATLLKLSGIPSGLDKYIEVYQDQF